MRHNAQENKSNEPQTLDREGQNEQRTIEMCSYIQHVYKFVHEKKKTGVKTNVMGTRYKNATVNDL